MTNKKMIAVLSAVVIVVGVFAACNQHTETVAQTTTSVAVSDVMVTLSEETSAPQTEVDTSADTTTSETEPVRSNTTTVRETTTHRSTTTTTQRAAAQTTTQTNTKKPTTTKSETTTKKKETTTAKKTTTTTTTTTTQASVDIGSFVSFAKDYGKSIGLHYDSSVTECWDNPITVTSTNGESAKRDIKSRLNRYKNVEDFTDFSVWYEKRSDGKYDLYIAYN